MASFDDPRKMMTCPYNASHQIEKYKMQVHLEKCRKQYPNAKKVKCPFDATHIVNEPELDYHVNHCPKREMFDRERFIVEDAAEWKPAVATVPMVPCSENWDDDNFTSYKPNLAAQNHIIKKIKGATPSERRSARMENVKTYRPAE